MTKKNKPIYVRGPYRLDYDNSVTPTGNKRPYLTIFWYDSAQRRTKRKSTRTTDQAEAIAKLDAQYLADTGQAPRFCSGCGRPMADGKAYLLSDAIADYKTEIGSKRVSASSIAARLDHILDFITARGRAAPSCQEAATEQFVIEFRRWNTTQPVCWKNKDGEITVTKPRTAAAVEESVHQLRAVLNHAASNARSDARPMFRSLTRQAVSRPVRDRASLAVIEDMISYAASDKRRMALHGFLVGSLCTLARPDAITDINTNPERRQWSRLDPFLDLNPAGRIQTKKHRPIIPVIPLLGEWLVATDESETSKGWLVNYFGEPVQNVHAAWVAMLKELKLPIERHWMPYILRRTLATVLRERHVNPWDLQGFMGHRVVRMTEIYTGSSMFATVTAALNDIVGEMGVRIDGALRPTHAPQFAKITPQNPRKSKAPRPTRLET